MDDRRRVRDELKAWVEKFDTNNYAAQRAREAACGVVRKKTTEFIAQRIAEIQTATANVNPSPG